MTPPGPEFAVFLMGRMTGFWRVGPGRSAEGAVNSGRTPDALSFRFSSEKRFVFRAGTRRGSRFAKMHSSFKA